MKKEMGKAKKAKKIMKLLNSPEARIAMKSLKTHAKYILALLTVAYITAFTVAQVIAGEHLEVVSRVDTAGLMANAAPIAAIDARVLEGARAGYLNATVESVQEEILRQADILETLGRDLYLGKGELRPPGKHVKHRFEAKTFEVEEWIDSEPARFVMVTTSLWDAVKLYYQNCRRVVHDVGEDVDMQSTREWRYVIRNGIKRMSAAMNDLLDQQTREADLHTLFVENILVAVLSILLLLFTVILAHFWRLLRKVSDERLGLYTVFVSIPRPIVVKLATKKITTGDDSDSDSDDDDNDDDNGAPKNNREAPAPIAAALMINNDNTVAEDQQLQRAQQTNNYTSSANYNNNGSGTELQLPGARFAPPAQQTGIPGGILARNSGAPWTPGRASLDEYRSTTTPQRLVDSGLGRASVDSAFGYRGGAGFSAAGGERKRNVYQTPPMMTVPGSPPAAAVPLGPPVEQAAATSPVSIATRFRAAASSLIGSIRQTVQSKVFPEQQQEHEAPRPTSNSGVNKFAKTGRKLDPAGSQLNVFALPILLWGVLVIFSFTLSYRQFQVGVDQGPP